MKTLEEFRKDKEAQLQQLELAKQRVIMLIGTGMYIDGQIALMEEKLKKGEVDGIELSE